MVALAGAAPTKEAPRLCRLTFWVEPPVGYVSWAAESLSEHGRVGEPISVFRPNRQGTDSTFYISGEPGNHLAPIWGYLPTTTIVDWDDWGKLGSEATWPLDHPIKLRPAPGAKAAALRVVLGFRLHYVVSGGILGVLAREFGARVVHEDRVGIPSAAATGYDAARGAVIARCDADSVPPRRWVERIARTLADPELDAVTGTGWFHDVPPVLRWLVEAAYLGSYYVLGHLALGHRPLWGSSMALRRSSWLAVRDDVHRDADVHDDMDLAFVLGPSAQIRFDPWLRVGVSARSVRGASQLRRRMGRAVVTLRLNWAVRPPWQRWQHRLRRSARSTATRGSRSR